MEAAFAEAAARTVSKGRRTSFTILTILFALVFGIAFFGWTGLIGGWFEGGDRIPHRVHDIGTGVIEGILFGGAFLLLARAPERRIAALQAVALSGVGFGLGSVLALDWVSLAFIPIAAVPVAVLLWLYPGHRGEFLAKGAGFSPALVVVAGVSAIGWVVYALAMARQQRIGLPGGPHVDEHHWTTMAAMAVALALIGLLASVKTRGWRIPAWAAGLGAAVWGLASVVFPRYPGAEGATWGALAIVSGAALIGVSEWEARRDRERAA